MPAPTLRMRCQHLQDLQGLRELARECGCGDEAVAEISGSIECVGYGTRAIIFGENCSADSLFWVSRGIVGVHRSLDDGSRVLMRILGRGDLLGITDRKDERGNWEHTFSATALTNCTLFRIPRATAYRALGSLTWDQTVAVIEHLNAIWADWVDCCGRFIGMRFRERLDDVLYQLGAKSGIRERDGFALSLDLSFEDLAEMIGASAPLVRRLIADLAGEGELARRGSRYILLKGGAIGSRLLRNSARCHPASMREARLPVAPLRIIADAID